MTSNAREISVALVQMTSSNDWQKNLEHAIELMEAALGESQADLIVLPENCLSFGSFGLDALNKNRQHALDKLAAVGAKHHSAVVAGSIPFRPEPKTSPRDRYASRCHFISPDGDHSRYYDKIHLFDVDVSDGTGRYRESDTYLAGSEVVTIPYDNTNIGMSICYDIRFPNLYRELRNAGAEILTLPAAFTEVTGEAHWEILARARAIETQCFLIAANQCGDHGNNRKTWGHSMIIDPWGQVLASCGSDPGFCWAKLDLDKLSEIRKNMPVAEHEKVWV